MIESASNPWYLHTVSTVQTTNYVGLYVRMSYNPTSRTLARGDPVTQFASTSTYSYSYVQTLCTLHVQQICKEDTIPQRFMQEPLTVLIAIKILSRCINHKRKNKRTNKKSHPFRLWHNIRNSGNNRRNLSNRMLLRKKKMYSTVNLAQQRHSCCDFQTQERWSTAKSLITKNTPPP